MMPKWKPFLIQYAKMFLLTIYFIKMRNILIFVFMGLCITISCKTKNQLIGKYPNIKEKTEAIVAIYDINKSSYSSNLTIRVEKNFSNRGYLCNQTRLTKNYINSPRFELLFDADIDEIKKLNLKKYSDLAILGKYKVLNFNSELNLMTIQLEYRVIELNSMKMVNNNILTERGIGLTYEEAEQAAIDRIIKMLN